MSAYLPNIEELQRLSRRAEVLTDAEVERVVQSARATRLQLDDLASLVKTVLAAPHSTPSEIILRHAEAIRQELFGPYVIPMAPVEISNACASDCMFCGWRASNREMKRLRMPLDLLLLQVEYLLDLGIYYIEFVSGDDIGAEFSVSFVPALRKWALVYSPADLSPEIRLRWANSPTGAWSEPQTVYRCPDVQKGQHVFCHAAKAHSELSAPNELLVTYATNSFEMSEVLNNAALYVPRFVRLRFLR